MHPERLFDQPRHERWDVLQRKFANLIVMSVVLSGACLLTIGAATATTVPDERMSLVDNQSVGVTASLSVLKAPNDTDADGLSNRRERELGTDPTSSDTDADQLTDRREIHVYRTDSLAADSDVDGLHDNRELHLGTDPTNADTDSDGLSDGREQKSGTSPRLADSDKNGLSDRIEVILDMNALTFDRDSETNTGNMVSIETIPTVVEVTLSSWAMLVGVFIISLWFIWQWYRRYTSPIVVKTE